MPYLLEETEATHEAAKGSHDFAEHVQRMLQSPHMARAETQRKLLAYLWEHRHESVSEYAIAIDALGRHSNFDPSTDASVRVHISRLRKKLKDYYQLEPGEPELLVIPVGSHQLTVMETAAIPVPAAPTVEAQSPKEWWFGHRFAMTVCVCAALLAAVTFLGWKVHALHERMSERPDANTFFNSFLAGSAPIKVVLPTPVFFSFKDVEGLKARMTDVNEFKDVEASEKIQQLAKKYGTPSLDQSYTVTYDTLAAIDMVRYLDSLGQNARVSVDVTRDSSMTMLERGNVIIFGTHATLQPMHAFLATLNFSLGAHEEWVRNAKPEADEQARYELKREGGGRQIEPSIVAVLPGRGPNTKVLLVESRKSVALVSFLTSTAGSNSIEQLWKQHGSPQFYEMVVLTEAQGDNGLRTWPVALHPYTAKAPASAM